MGIEHKTVLITGASRGIGAATARHMAALGANVVLAARSFDQVEMISQEIESAGGAATPIQMDVADFEQVDAAVQCAIYSYGALDILVNNAGMIDPIARIGDTDPKAWGQVVDINLKGVYHSLKAAVPHMVARGGGTIINISSGAATGVLEGWSHYCATKAAVLSLTRCTHKEYGDKGIRSIGISPGTVATDMQVSIKDSGINPVSQLDPSVHIPSEWVAQAIAKLCMEVGDAFLGEDFTLKTNEGRSLMGLPPID